MKKTVIICFILVLFIPVHAGFAGSPPSREEKTTAPPPHKKKIFIDEKEKRIYWPMSMPFWVRLTASPEKDAPSYLLEKVHTKSPADSKQYMEKGIKLEVEGHQFIRWYNAITDETTYLTFYADGDAPELEAALAGAPLYKAGEKVFYGKGLKCTVSARDKISGVEGVYISMDGAAFVPYTGELAFDTGKDCFLRFYAVDRVGYASEPKAVRFTVDLTPPETRRQVHNNFSGDVLSTGTTIQLAGEDETSGLKDIFYLLDDQKEPSLYRDEKITLDRLADGEHRLHYYSVDNVLNMESKKTYEFYLDRTPPVAESRFAGDHHRENGVDYISPRTEIELSAADNKIGVERIEYMFGGDRYLTYSGPFKTPFKSGEHMISYRAVDRLGNVGPATGLPVRMDGTPPTSTGTIVGKKFQQRDTTWITRNTTIELSAADDASGVRGIYFQLGEKNEYRLYTGPISITEEGRYLFKFYSADHVDNRESEQPYIIIVDNSAPTMMKTFSVPKTGTVPDEQGGEIDVYPRYTSLFFGAVDNSAGIAGIWYSVNGAREQAYSIPLVFKEEGNFSLVLRLQDNVGNARSESIRFIIKD